MTRPLTRADEDAGAETVSALILFGLFVTVIAFLNVESVPAAGYAQEAALFDEAVEAVSALVATAESAGVPGMEGTSTARIVPLKPHRDVGQDFFSLFMAVPAVSTGELTFVQDHGDVRVTHTPSGGSEVVDVGSVTTPLPFGRLRFDPHPIYRDAGVVDVALGGVVTTDGDPEVMRFAPPFDVTVENGVTTVTATPRILTGTPVSIGGGASARVSLTTESATVVTPPDANAARVDVRIETAHGVAWAAHFRSVSEAAGLDEATSEFAVTRAAGAGSGGLDVVTWTVYGEGSGNDVRLITGSVVHTIRIG